MRTRRTGQALTGFGMEGALGQDWGGSQESGKAQLAEMEAPHSQPQGAGFCSQLG